MHMPLWCYNHLQFTAAVIKGSRIKQFQNPANCEVWASVADNILRFVDVVHLLLVGRCCFYAKIATVQQHLQSLQSVTHEHTEKVAAIPCRIASDLHKGFPWGIFSHHIWLQMVKKWKCWTYTGTCPCRHSGNCDSWKHQTNKTECKFSHETHTITNN